MSKFNLFVNGNEVKTIKTKRAGWRQIKGGFKMVVDLNQPVEIEYLGRIFLAEPKDKSERGNYGWGSHVKGDHHIFVTVRHGATSGMCDIWVSGTIANEPWVPETQEERPITRKKRAKRTEAAVAAQKVNPVSSDRKETLDDIIAMYCS